VLDLTGRDVVIVEDLVDTGLTLAYLVGYVEGLGARRVAVCALLDRPARRIVPVAIGYVGVVIDDVFVVGGGLHHQDRYRNLPVVLDVDRAAVAADPDAYRSWYSRPEERAHPGGTLDVESEATA
jgi:hypoxanthine phosphoribosyltransferase